MQLNNRVYDLCMFIRVWSWIAPLHRFKTFWGKICNCICFACLKMWVQFMYGKKQKGAHTASLMLCSFHTPVWTSFALSGQRAFLQAQLKGSLLLGSPLLLFGAWIPSLMVMAWPKHDSDSLNWVAWGQALFSIQSLSLGSLRSSPFELVSALQRQAKGVDKLQMLGSCSTLAIQADLPGKHEVYLLPGTPTVSLLAFGSPY